MFQNKVVMGILWHKREEENKIRMHEPVNSELKSGNACYNSIQNLLSSRVRSKNIKIKIYRTIIFPLLYCFNSCTSLHFKTLISHTKTLKIRPYIFRSPLKPSTGGPWPYFATLLNWNADLHLL